MIPIKQGPVGILVSGGADSAMLLYLLMKEHTDKIYIFSLASSFKNNLNAKCCIDVVSKCAELTGNQNFEHIMDYCHVQDSSILFELPNKYLTEEKINWIYTGITKNPSATVTDTFIDPTTETHERDPSIVRDVIDNTRKVITPFTNIDKVQLSDLYKEYAVLDSLFSLTRSCETLDSIGFDHCGVCWWCEERNWGFGRLI